MASESVFVWRRRYQRYAHLALATWLGAFLYSPLGEEALALTLTRAVVFPALVVSGLLLWKGPTLRRRLRR
jgi:D-alanyl-lipoteichoic acid acyltransferase DltB (MBOAT superfamily)